MSACTTATSLRRSGDFPLASDTWVAAIPERPLLLVTWHVTRRSGDGATSGRTSALSLDRIPPGAHAVHAVEVAFQDLNRGASCLGGLGRWSAQSIEQAVVSQSAARAAATSHHPLRRHPSVFDEYVRRRVVAYSS